MISRRLRKLVAIVAGALAAGVPVTLIHRGVDTYIERQSAEEVRLAAQRAIAQAEWRIGQTIQALAAVGGVADGLAGHPLAPGEAGAARQARGTSLRPAASRPAAGRRLR